MFRRRSDLISIDQVTQLFDAFTRAVQVGAKAGQIEIAPFPQVSLSPDQAEVYRAEAEARTEIESAFGRTEAPIGHPGTDTDS